MKKLSRLLLTSSLFALSACSTLTLDKDRAAEQRQQELCGEIDTRDLPHCSGTLAPEPAE